MKHSHVTRYYSYPKNRIAASKNTTKAAIGGIKPRTEPISRVSAVRKDRPSIESRYQSSNKFETSSTSGKSAAYAAGQLWADSVVELCPELKRSEIRSAWAVAFKMAGRDYEATLMLFPAIAWAKRTPASGFPRARRTSGDSRP